MRGSKPGERRGGRKKGTPNKIPHTVKQAIERAFIELGGHEYLVEQGKNNPTAFLTLLGKVMPTQINANVNTRELPASVNEFV